MPRSLGFFLWIIAWYGLRSQPSKLDIMLNGSLWKQENLSASPSFSSTIISKHIDELWGRGYLAVQVDSIEEKKDGSVVWIRSGKRYIYSGADKVVLSGSAGLNALGIRNGERLGIGKLNRIRDRWLQNMANRGFPAAEIQFDVVGEDTTGGNIKLEIAMHEFPGSKYRISQLQLEGNVKLNPVVEKYLLGFRSGMLYHRKVIMSIPEKLNRLPFLKVRGPLYMEVQDSLVSLALPVGLRKANSFSGILGFMPENDQTGGILFTGDIRLQLHNVFGYTESAELQWQSLQSQTQQLKVRLHWPFLFGTALGVRGETDFFRVDTSFYQLNLGVSLNYRLQGVNEIGFYTRYRIARKVWPEGGAPVISAPDAQSQVFGIRGLWSSLDHPENPKSGWYCNVSAGIGLKSLLTDSTYVLPPEANQTIEWQSELTIKKFFPIGKRMTIMSAGKMGWMENPYLFMNDLYRIGGIHTLRGVDEDALYVSRYGIATIEWRYLIDEYAHFLLFTEGGLASRNTIEMPKDDTVLSTGMGLTFLTVAGQFSVHYAIGGITDRTLSLNRSKVHFGYSARF